MGQDDKRPQASGHRHQTIGIRPQTLKKGGNNQWRILIAEEKVMILGISALTAQIGLQVAMMNIPANQQLVNFAMSVNPRRLITDAHKSIADLTKKVKLAFSPAKERVSMASA